MRLPLTLLALLVLPSPALAGKLHVRKAEQWPTLAPVAAFDGTPCSGYGGTCPNSDAPKFSCAPGATANYGGGCQTTPGTPDARTAAQPAIHWIVPSEQRLVSDKLICVDADAKGGVRYVRFYGEGGVADVYTPGFIHYTDSNGRFRTKWGYCARLDAAAWRAETTTGSGRLFAEAFPIRSDMTSRIIGHAHVYTDAGARTYDTAAYAGNYTMTIYPRTAEHDWPGDADGTKTVCASGCDYTTIKLAIDAAATASAEAPKIVLNASENYELESRGSTYTSGKGYLTIAAAAGVTATLRRATAYSGSETNAGSVWTWTVGWDGVEFRGEGVVIDRKNFTSMTFGTKSPWFNGIRFTNSIGARDTTYWSGANPPDFSIGVPGFWDDAVVEYSVGPLQDQRYVINTAVRETGGHVFGSAHYVYGTYVRNYSNEFYRTGPASLSIAYSGAGSPTATSTGTHSAAGTLALKVNGATVCSVAQGKISSDTNPTISALAAAINACGGGWSAAVLNSQGSFRASSLGSGPNTYGAFTDVAISGGGTSFYRGYDVHAEWAMLYTGGTGASLTPRQNMIWRNNVTRDFQVGPFVNMACGLCYDLVAKNNVFLGDPASFSDNDLDVAATTVAGSTRSHIVFNHNTWHSGIVRTQTGSPQDTTFSEGRNNILGVGFNSGGSDLNNDAAWDYNFFIQCCGGLDWSASGGTGNTKYATNPASDALISQAFRDLFRDWAGGDVRPSSGGTVDSNQKPSGEIYDIRGCRRSASDWAGALSKNCVSLPVYPF